MEHIFFQCPRCKSASIVKSGIIKASGRQRYKCKFCHYFFTVTQNPDPYQPHKKYMVADMHLNYGMSFREISKLIGMSHVTAYRWFNSLTAEELASIKRSEAEINAESEADPELE